MWDTEGALRLTPLGLGAVWQVLMDSHVLFFKTLLWRVTVITLIWNSCQKWEEGKSHHLYAERHNYQKVKCILNFIASMESVAWKLDSQ